MRGVVIAFLLLQGCAAAAPAPGVDALHIEADAVANGRRPVAVDVVRVGDAALAERLDGLDAAAWFRTRIALRREAGGRIAIASWEVVPGQTIALHSLPPYAATPVATFVYARYATPGAHRARLAGAAPVRLRLGPDGFAAEGGAP
ncbi:type VI secretion protein [Azospirillum sp. TSO22-1]|uniref:type VI secretion protein n=1 Tax=Azospirillum sp. TSO22-1 TaxID=716789 RepID=UPI000D61F5E5|nr:type VI secretion protein [Azospirillum sp. TSO22-1]PWC44226.1 hypothetical protein TSO221_18160 [Azospirillum sp. TSO22-1]